MKNTEIDIIDRLTDAVNEHGTVDRARLIIPSKRDTESQR